MNYCLSEAFRVFAICVINRHWLQEDDHLDLWAFASKATRSVESIHWLLELKQFCQPSLQLFTEFLDSLALGNLHHWNNFVGSRGSSFELLLVSVTLCRSVLCTTEWIVCSWSDVICSLSISSLVWLFLSLSDYLIYFASILVRIASYYRYGGTLVLGTVFCLLSSTVHNLALCSRANAQSHNDPSRYAITFELLTIFPSKGARRPFASRHASSSVAEVTKLKSKNSQFMTLIRSV